MRYDDQLIPDIIDVGLRGEMPLLDVIPVACAIEALAVNGHIDDIAEDVGAQKLIEDTLEVMTHVIRKRESLAYGSNHHSHGTSIGPDQPKPLSRQFSIV